VFKGGGCSRVEGVRGWRVFNSGGCFGSDKGGGDLCACVSGTRKGKAFLYPWEQRVSGSGGCLRWKGGGDSCVSETTRGKALLYRGEQTGQGRIDRARERATERRGRDCGAPVGPPARVVKLTWSS